MLPIRPLGAATIGSSVLFTVALAACNAPPTGVDVTLSPEAPTTTQPLVAEHSEASDDNGDPISYRYSWYKDGQVQGNVDAQAELSSAYTAKGETWRVEVTAFDGTDAGPAGTAEVTIVNSLPVTTATISPENPTTNDNVRATVTKSDADGDIMTERFVWIKNGSPQSMKTSTLDDSELDKGDVWELRYYASDDEGEGEPASVTFTVANTPPEVAKARLSSSIPDKNDELTCIGEGWEDDDGDPAGYTYEWVANGEIVSTDAVLDLSELTRGDTIRCRLTAFDGEDAGNTVVSGEAILQNTGPSLDTVTISPESPLKDDTVTIEVSGASDPDGDEVQFLYAWYVGGVESGTSEVLPSTRFRKDDNIYVEVTPFDGEAEGESVRSNIIVAGNNPPTIIEARLEPEDPYTDDIIELVVFDSDPDGDEVDLSVQWYVDSTLVSGVSGLELDGESYFDKEDDIYAIVTPNDGRDSGAAVTTDSLVAINTVPTKPETAIDPKTPDGTTDVVCKVVEASVDADGDTLTYDFRWTVNGGAPSVSPTTTTYADDTLPAAAYDADDVLICRTTVSDGESTSPEAITGNLLGSKERPGADCDAILDERTDAETGTYWIDPDEDGDYSDAYEVVCDMDSDGGGWTMVYYNDAEHFDGFYLNSTSRTSTAPTKINDQKELWNIPSDLSHTETLLGCTTQGDAQTHWWRYASSYPYDDWNSTSYTTRYVSRSSSSDSGTSTPTATCYSNYKGGGSNFYGFAALTAGTCGCSNMVWGMNHYSNRTSSYGSNCTDTTSYGTHTSKWRTKTLYYPICNKTQTSNGKFWIAVR